MIVKNCMKRRVITVQEDETIGAAAALFREHHIGTLPVVDKDRHLIGLVRLQGLLALIMPDFVRLNTHYEYVHDFGAVETRQPDPEQLEKCVVDVMDEPVSVLEDSGLVMATSLLQDHKLSDLPVVDRDNKVVGLASHVDIGVALMSKWALPKPVSSELP